MFSIRARRVAALAALVLVVAGCNSTDRPDAATWLRSWQAITAVIPDQADLGDSPEESICQTALAAVRERRADLLPTPSARVDELANEWVSIAETAFFECPPQGESINSFDDAYRELARVEESVETALSD